MRCQTGLGHADNGSYWLTLLADILDCRMKLKLNRSACATRRHRDPKNISYACLFLLITETTALIRLLLLLITETTALFRVDCAGVRFTTYCVFCCTLG